ncbi:MAG: hypothetical protein U0638_13050 [Phycisphaerales bacterium]
MLMKLTHFQRRTSNRLRLASLLAAMMVAVLWLLNLPFYSGSRIGSLGSWRLEHGRFTLNWGRPSTESFYIAINSEPVRWKAEFTHYSPGEWQIVVPLWVVGALALGAAGTFWRLERRACALQQAAHQPPVVNPPAPP